MSTALVYLFILLPVVAIAWIIWSYRRKAGHKEARSREREMELIGLLQGDKAPRPAPAAPAPAAVSPAAPAPVPRAAVTATRRERFLSQPETLIYYLLRAGMAGYEVFPRVSLGSVVASAQPAGRPGAQSPPNTHDLDFVVCDKSMRIVAAVQMAGRLAQPDSARVERNLAAAGIRLVTIDPKALPKREQLGALILGSQG
jgi:hypothetical protein